MAVWFDDSKNPEVVAAMQKMANEVCAVLDRCGVQQNDTYKTFVAHVGCVSAWGHRSAQDVVDRFFSYIVHKPGWWVTQLTPDAAKDLRRHVDAQGATEHSEEAVLVWVRTRIQE